MGLIEIKKEIEDRMIAAADKLSPVERHVLYAYLHRGYDISMFNVDYQVEDLLRQADKGRPIP